MGRPRLVNDGPDSSTRRASLPADQRPFDYTPITTDDLPSTPTRDRNISATAWVDAPPLLLELGAGLDVEPSAIAYKRRIGIWLLWRAGPTRGPARYMAIAADDLTRSYTFDINVEGDDFGVGPSGQCHTRFRLWKEDLLGRALPS